MKLFLGQDERGVSKSLWKALWRYNLFILERLGGISCFLDGLADGIVQMRSVLTQVVNNFAPKFGLLTVLRDNLATKRYLLFRSLLLLLFLALVGGATAGQDVQNPSLTSFGPGPQFAIADFDGDLRPDLASIQAGSNSFGTTDYWIQLQLSAAGRQSIQVVAPAGGLWIEARDVNGDHAVDLVLTTAWFRKPVAIFLNDGHGNFSRAEPSAFPDAFTESTANWAPACDQATDAVGVLAQSRAGVCPKIGAFLSAQLHGDSIPFLSARFRLNSFLISHAGRAPPYKVPGF
jgi:hypothetical protein